MAGSRHSATSFSRAPERLRFQGLLRNIEIPTTQKPVREKVTAIAGVLSGIGDEYHARRVALRNSWFPNSEEGIRQLQVQTGVVVRFVMGFSLIEEENMKVAEEEKMFGNMIRLDVREKYHNVVLKTRRYLQKVLELYDFDFAVKVDDDVYHNPHRLSHAAQEWKAGGVDFVGCFWQTPLSMQNWASQSTLSPMLRCWATNTSPTHPATYTACLGMRQP